MPDFLKIRVKRGKQGYGFVLSNQAPCVVSSIAEGGPADIALLKVGDEILEVNDENVSRSTHEHVVRLLLKYSAPEVSLLVCRYTDVFDNVDACTNEDKNDLHSSISSISETVEKVVQDLNGPLKLGSLKVFKNEAPTKEKRNLVQETSFEKSEFEEKVYGPQKRAASQNLSDVNRLFGQNQSDSLDLKVIVGYLQTTELPDSRNVSISSQNVLDNYMKGLHIKSKKVNQHFLMHISLDDITFSSSAGQEILIYPLKAIYYTCNCPDDHRYFGIVAKKEPLTEGSTSPYNTKKTNIEQQQAEVCFCHIFMVDPELSSHSQHKSISESFGFKCEPEPSSGKCELFPSNSLVILEKLESLFHDISISDSSSSNDTHSNFYDEISDGGLQFSERLQIKDKMKSTKTHGKYSMEVKNFTRSPFKQRKPIPLPFYDGEVDSIQEKNRNMEGMSIEENEAFCLNPDVMVCGLYQYAFLKIYHHNNNHQSSSSSSSASYQSLQSSSTITIHYHLSSLSAITNHDLSLSIVINL